MYHLNMIHQSLIVIGKTFQIGFEFVVVIGSLTGKVFRGEQLDLKSCFVAEHRKPL